MEAARRAATAARRLACLTEEVRNRALVEVAAALETQAEAVLEANARDREAASAQVAAGEMSEALFRRLLLDEAKLETLVLGIRQIARMPDPVGQVSLATELDEGLELFRVTCPIGVVGVIFESRPEALPQIASLCLKSGNAVVLKGGSEAAHSNRKLAELIRGAAVNAGAPSDWLTLLEGRDEVTELLEADEYVDLIVPRGSNGLVRHIQANTAIPVLGHADGVCHVYIDAAADPEQAVAVSVDAKVQYPAACNAVETILVHRDVAPDMLPALVDALSGHRVEVRCDERALSLAGSPSVISATDDDWGVEFNDLVVAIKIVDGLEDAIAHVNLYGSGHTEAIVTDDDSAFERFFAEVDAAGVYRNASTRFADGLRYGFGAEVGISTGKLHPRGPVGLEGLVTYKYKLVGAGHIVSSYSGSNARAFTHRRID
jgi:glutamate-5-semialdehyde dehydrogenase